jgi:hypothetical protein
MVDRAFIELLTKSAEGLAAMTKSPDFDIAYSQYVDLLISRAHTMIGTARLRNLADLVRRALDDKIPLASWSVDCWRLTATQADAFLWQILSPVCQHPNRGLYPFDMAGGFNRN